MNTTIQIRIDKKMKIEASKIFKSMGLTISGGCRLYLAYVANTGKIPFEITTVDNISENKKKTAE